MIGGISSSSFLPEVPSLIQKKEEEKSFIDKIKNQKEERRILGNASSSSSENSQNILSQPSTSAQIRYGEAPSSIQREADTGLNTSGVRNFEPPTKPELAQKIENSRGSRRVDNLQDSISERNRIAGVITRYPRSDAEPTAQQNLIGTEHPPSQEFAKETNPPPYVAFLREYQEPKEKPQTGKKLDLQF